MGIEIERKFLVAPGWLPPTPGVKYVQGYLHSGGTGATVRARIAGEKAYLTIKGPSAGSARLEFEYPIPVEDAAHMLKELSRGRLVEKHRHLVVYEGHTWEVDVFSGDNEGLVVAEIELGSVDEPFALPPWAARDVTEDNRYANAWLSIHPYSEWSGKDESP